MKRPGKITFAMRLFAGIGAVALLGVVGVFSYARIRYETSALYLHLESLPWQTVMVDSSNLPQPVHIERGDIDVPIRVGPIEHGIYRIRIRLLDGRTVWSEFLHTDAGRRHRVDVFVTPSSRSGYLHFRQTSYKGAELFQGEVCPEDTSEQKPFRLVWI